jgi:PAS domain S-box-containing protein
VINHTDGFTAGSGTDEQLRVLLLVAQERDRELFAEQLADGYDVVTATPDGEWPAFDLCVVDSAWYREVSSRLTGLRAAAEPVGLPVLLLLRGEPSDHPWLADALGESVDDVVELPTGRMELDSRVGSLARDRSMSKALVEQRDRLRLFRRAMDEAAVGVTISDYRQPDNPLVYVNTRFEETTGYGMPDAMGRNCRFLQGPETDPEPVAELRRAIDAGEATTVRLRNYRKDGTLFWNRVSIAPIRNDEGTVTHFVGFQQDVTEELERERRVETLLQAAADPIYELDSEGRFTLVNDAMVAAMGYDRDELLGAHISLVMPEEKVVEGERLTRELAETDEQRATLETPVVTADGEQHIYQVSISLREPDHGGGVEGIVGVCRDVTDLRRNERRLSVFDRVLRHNLRNKMNIILARAEAIAAGDEDPRPEAEAIAVASRELLALSERTRKFHSSINPEGEPARIDVADLCRRVAAEHRKRRPRADITVSAPGSAVVQVHETLELAVDELVRNALSHNDRAAPTVELQVRVDDGAADGNQRVVVEVADDGPGIGDLERRAIERGHETPLDHGTGLGLWFVRWTVTNAGGDIAIEANEPRGTVVRLSLPRAEGPQGPPNPNHN